MLGSGNPVGLSLCDIVPCVGIVGCVITTLALCTNVLNTLYLP